MPMHTLQAVAKIRTWSMFVTRPSQDYCRDTDVQPYDLEPESNFIGTSLIHRFLSKV